MNDEKNVLEYDEDDSVKFIRTHLPKEMNNKFSDDDINYIVDIIYEYYDEKGFLNDTNEDIEIEEDELIEFVIKATAKDEECSYTNQEIEAIIQGELAYCDSLNLFE